jgi:hypothetical protein
VTATGSSVSHAYAASGAYTVLVTATDATGVQATDASTAMIGPTPPLSGPPPPSQTLTFAPSADATIKLDKPTSNFGDVGYLEAMPTAARTS